MKTKTLILPFLFILIMSSVIVVRAQTNNLTITTDKQSYNYYDQITLSGTLQANGISSSDAFIGLQIQNPDGTPLILRTIQTGNVQDFSMPTKITSAYFSDLGKNPVNTIANGNSGYATITVQDQDAHSHENLVLAYSVYDGNGVPLGVPLTNTLSLGASAAQTSTLPINIPLSAHAGTAYCYVDVYDDFPQNNGLPMAQEQSFQFTITGGHASTGPAPSNNGNSGAYSMTFRLPKASQNGAYLVYASSPFGGFRTVNSTSFSALLVGDFNGDSKVDGTDLIVFCNAYIMYYQNQPFNHLCDINNDGKVTGSDFIKFTAAYIQFWAY